MRRRGGAEAPSGLCLSFTPSCPAGHAPNDLYAGPRSVIRDSELVAPVLADPTPQRTAPGWTGRRSGRRLPEPAGLSQSCQASLSPRHLPLSQACSLARSCRLRLGAVFAAGAARSSTGGSPLTRSGLGPEPESPGRSASSLTRRRGCSGCPRRSAGCTPSILADRANSSSSAHSSCSSASTSPARCRPSLAPPLGRNGSNRLSPQQPMRSSAAPEVHPRVLGCFLGLRGALDARMPEESLEPCGTLVAVQGLRARALVGPSLGPPAAAAARERSDVHHTCMQAPPPSGSL